MKRPRSGVKIATKILVSFPGTVIAKMKGTTTKNHARKYLVAILRIVRFRACDFVFKCLQKFSFVFFWSRQGMMRLIMSMIFPRKPLFSSLALALVLILLLRILVSSLLPSTFSSGALTITLALVSSLLPSTISSGALTTMLALRRKDPTPYDFIFFSISRTDLYMRKMVHARTNGNIKIIIYATDITVRGNGLSFRSPRPHGIVKPSTIVPSSYPIQCGGEYDPDRGAIQVPPSGE